MRIIVAGPPKTGNIWVKHILAEVYGLKNLTPHPRADAGQLKRFVDQGGFIDNAIFHEHYWPTGLFFEVVESLQARVVTILRNPYDAFVSLYFYIQNFPHLFGEHDRHRPLVGKPIDHPDVLAFLADDTIGFGYSYMKRAGDWVAGNPAAGDHFILTRYEVLRTNTFDEIKRITTHIQPVEDPVIRRAIDVCSAGNMRKKSRTLSKHVRKAAVGDWKNYLTRAHLETFERCYGDLIVQLGYEVAPPEQAGESSAFPTPFPRQRTFGPGVVSQVKDAVKTLVERIK
ncbi:MAG: sulfotransferase domain-containing protein [Anaerolineae bacterium]